MVERKDGSQLFELNLVIDSHRCMASLDARGGCSGLSSIDGKGANANETTHRGQLLPKGKPCKVVYTVRKSSVEMTVDDKPIFIYKGDLNRLSTYSGWVLPTQKVLFIGTYDSIFAITKIELTPISGKGKPLQR
jgi:hypothetical protein